MSFTYIMERESKTTHLKWTRNIERIKDQCEKDYPFSLNNILFIYKVQALQTRKHVYIVSIHLEGIQK